MSIKKEQIVDREDAHTWLVDNPYLFSGYRKNFSTKKLIAKSLCMKHNEVTHIWTHLIGALVFIFFTIFLITQRSYYVSIYNDIKHDFSKFHLNKFDDVFKSEIAYFLEEIKHQAQVQSQNFTNLRHKTQQFFSKKVVEYVNELKEFGKVFKKNEHKRIQKYEKYLDNMLKSKSDFQKKFIDLDKFEDLSKINYTEHINEVFNLDKKRILQELKIIADLEYYPIYIYLLSATLCLGFSAIYHTFNPLSKKVNDILQRLDMAGISILIFGSCFASSFYLYHCNGILKKFYMFIQFSTCLAAFIATLSEKLHKEEFTHIKGLIFGALGLGNGLSISHAFYIFRFQHRLKDFDLVFVGAVIMGILYLTGLFFYIKKIPERFWPRKFDIWFNSHTIFHLFVFVAAVQYYFTLEFLYQKRVENMCLKLIEKYN